MGEHDHERRIRRLENWRGRLKDVLGNIFAKYQTRLIDHERRLDAAELHSFSQDSRIADLEQWRQKQEALLKSAGTGPLARGYTADDWVVIYEKMARYFNDEEFQDLCFRLGISPDEIPGKTMTTRCRELVLLCRRTLRADDLIVQLKRVRPNAQWP